MSEYRFHEYTSSAFTVDPVFKSNSFVMFGSAENYNTPILFEVDKYRYVLSRPYDMKDDNALMYKIAAYLFHHPTSINRTPVTYFFGDINLCKEISEGFTNQIKKVVSIEMIEAWFPKSINDINRRVINYFLARQTHYGQEYEWTNNDINLLLFIDPELSAGEQNRAYNFITNQLFKKGLLVATRKADNRIWFALSEEAMDLFQESEETSDSSNLAFIAIKFAGNEERIQAIQKAIVEAGYEPRIMNEYETNNWIMPEIFHQIKISKFVVVDLSVRCDGAYYEAGYAYALGKEVIHIYDKREEENNPLHFDVAQKSTVIYNNYEELVEKLVNRIRATVD
jgi:nucleoside 2-deoxyribosyltransferase